MIYLGYYRGTAISFMRDSIFKEDNQLIVKRPFNCSDESDMAIPQKIPLKNITLKEESKRLELEQYFEHSEKVKQQAKEKKNRKKFATV